MENETLGSQILLLLTVNWPLWLSVFQDLYLPALDRPTASAPLSSSPDASRSVLKLHRSFNQATVCLDYFTSNGKLLSRTVFSVCSWFLTSACFTWTMCCFDYTGYAASFLLMHALHICLSHICLFHCRQDGSNTRHCGDLVLVPVFYWDHNESQSTTYTVNTKSVDL